ncbi:cation transporter [Candidatus Peregrinibacteria bacterium]|nr:cation transporter [Candidatus Peregrinibacteria bacterium]
MEQGQTQIKNNKEVHLEQLRDAAKSARKWIFIYAGLTVFKFIGGYLSNLVVLFADAFGNFIVILSTLMLYLGIRASLKKADDQFKYGYHRIETFAGFCLSLLIIYGGYKALIQSADQLFTPEKTSYLLFAAISSLISCGLSYSAYRYDKNMSNKINSVAFQASYADDRNSMLSSTGVLIAVGAEYFHIPYVQGIIGVIIAAIVIVTGVLNAKDAFLYLIDYWNKPEVEQRIRKILEKSRIISEVKLIRLRHVGTFIFGEAFLGINPFTDLRDLRSELRRLEKKVEEDVEHIGDIILYIDPPIPHTAKVAIPIIKEDGLASIIADDTKQKFQFFFAQVLEGKIIGSSVTKETFTIQEIGRITEFLKKENVNIIISNMVNALLYYNLRLNVIRVYPHFAGVPDVGNTIKLLLLDL